jgi:hypothetical protein
MSHERGPRLVFAEEVNTEVKALYERALIEHHGHEETAIAAVVDWFYQNRGRETPAAHAMASLVTHAVKSALAQVWLDRLEESPFRVEGGPDEVTPDR